MLRTRLAACAIAIVAVVGVVALSRGQQSSTAAPNASAPRASTTSTAAPPTTPATTVPAATTTTTPASTTTAGPAPVELAGRPAVGWKPHTLSDGRSQLWTLFTHPLAAAPGVTLSAAVFDPTQFTAALFNGTGTPGGSGWHNGSRVPPAAAPALRIAFNGGFMLKHITGGYVTEGHTVQRLAKGHATLAIAADGRLSVGALGSQIVDDGSWLSLRQNLPPIVEHGASSIARYPGTYWGDNFNHVETDYRSALCTRADGRLMYITMALVKIEPFADTLPKFGCQFGMELDINGHWPQFVWFTGSGAHPMGHLLENRMRKPDRVLTGSQKDFVALFDPSSLPSGALWTRS